MSENRNETVSTLKVDDLADRICTRYFEPPLKKLFSTLELLKNYETFLQGEDLIAHLFDVPLMSDVQANNLCHFFSRPQPQVLEDNATAASPVQWADIVRIPTYEPALQDDGSYHLFLAERNIWLKLSESDHNLMKTPFPRQMIDHKSYPDDVKAEIEATELARAQMTRWQKAVFELSKTVEAGLLCVANRIQALQRSEIVSCSRDLSPQPPKLHGAQIVPSCSQQFSRSATRKKGKKKTQRINWSEHESDNLGPWFKENRRLLKKAMERKYLEDTGIRRPYSGLVSKLYALNLGYLTHKRGASPEKDNATSTTDSGDIARINISQSHLARDQIMAASELHFDATEVIQSEDSFRPPPNGVAGTADSSISQRTFNSEEFMTSTSVVQDRQLSHGQTEISWNGRIMPDLPQNFGGPVSHEVSEKLYNVYPSKYSGPSILDGDAPKTLLPSCSQLIEDSEKANGNNPFLEYQDF